MKGKRIIIKTKDLPDSKEVLKQLPVVHFLEPESLYFLMMTPKCISDDVCMIEVQHVKVGDVIGTREGAFFEQNIHATCSDEIVAQEKHYEDLGKKDKHFDLILAYLKVHPNEDGTEVQIKI